MRVTTNTHNYLYAFLLGIVISLSLFILLKPSASAATINVVAGTDAINDNDQCQLSEAIENINDQAQTNNDCPAGDGNNDTINLPAGTITLSANTTIIITPVTIQGQSRAETIIHGDGEFRVFQVEDVQSGVVSFQRLTIQSFEEFAITAATSNQVRIDDVEIDGEGAVPGDGAALGGILVAGTSGEISNTYVHSLSGSNLPGMFGINVQTEQDIEVEFSISNVTIDDLVAENSNVNGIGVANGILTGSLTPATSNVIITNVSISNLTATGSNSTASGVTALAAVINGESIINILLKNTTITSLQSPGGILNSAIGTAGVAGSENDLVNITITGQNNLLSAQSPSCARYGDIAELFGNPTPSAGTITENITSLGGNISDDQSCNDYFTESTDKNNITNLADYIGDIADNGGSVPTMALLPGNPAIDGGVCGEGVPSTDARGITRPQGKTCDSGAYEVEQAASTGTVAGDTAVALNVPTGVVVNEFSTVSGSIPADNQGDAEYEFPLGLLSFELGVVEGSANEISLDFESDLDPESVVARKYNPSDQTYTTLENAVVTKITKDNQPTLRLTYTITDGTFPDLDNQANGTIIDPIGLATEKQGVLANTGDLIILAIPIGLSLLLGAFIVTYIDYRKHKKPLQEADQELAKTYTYWHHLKTVTIPLFSYRLSFGFERRERAAGF